MGGRERTVAVGRAGQIGKIYLACLVITRYINDPNKESRINLVFLCGYVPRATINLPALALFECGADLPFARNRLQWDGNMPLLRATLFGLATVIERRAGMWPAIQTLLSICNVICFIGGKLLHMLRFDF